MMGKRNDDEGAADYPLHVLREYALLADGERGALVGPRGDIVWMCSPRWDSDAVFSSLIGGSGRYAITPTDARFVWGGYYEEGSLIWRSRWITETGIIECREALAFPGDPDRTVLLRRIIAVQGEARVRVCLDARAGYRPAPALGPQPRRQRLGRPDRHATAALVRGRGGQARQRPGGPARAGHGPHRARRKPPRPRPGAVRAGASRPAP